jgi:hypothetical protein
LCSRRQSISLRVDRLTGRCQPANARPNPQFGDLRILLDGGIDDAFRARQVEHHVPDEVVALPVWLG